MPRIHHAVCTTVFNWAVVSKTSERTYLNSSVMDGVTYISITIHDINITLSDAPPNTNVTCGMMSSRNPKLTSSSAGGWAIQPSAAASILNGVTSATCGEDALNSCVDALEAYGSVITDASGNGVIPVGRWSAVCTHLHVQSHALTSCPF